MKEEIILSVKDVSKSFRGLKAISHVSIDLLQGEILGLIGPNGAGKTTLFNIVSGFAPPSTGDVQFLGKTLLGLKPNQISRMGLARTFQIVKPFQQLSILQNVAVGCFNWTSNIEEAETHSWEVLKTVGLAKKALGQASATTTPDRKRLELARALASKPKLMLLDEVMAGLNPTEQADIIALVKKIRESGISIFIIEHSMRVIMGLCDHICVIHHGERLSMGTPKEICADRKVIEAYLGEGNAFVKAG
jgi:branched-chain amino acid transport system ATP-binding protein